MNTHEDFVKMLSLFQTTEKITGEDYYAGMWRPNLDEIIRDHQPDEGCNQCCGMGDSSYPCDALRAASYAIVVEHALMDSRADLRNHMFEQHIKPARGDDDAIVSKLRDVSGGTDV